MPRLALRRALLKASAARSRHLPLSPADPEAIMDRVVGPASSLLRPITNANPRLFIWSADPDTIIAAASRAVSVRFDPLETTP
jgi:hypothetical protein